MSLEITNLPEFNKALGKIVKRNEQQGSAIITKVSMDTFRFLQRKTPKDTSRAASGWNNTIDAQPSEWKPVKGKKSYRLTQFAGRGKIKFNSMVNISNNVEYILPLEHGHSKIQSPTGMVNPVISGMTAYLNKLVSIESRRVVK